MGNSLKQDLAKTKNLTIMIHEDYPTINQTKLTNLIYRLGRLAILGELE